MQQRAIIHVSLNLHGQTKTTGSLGIYLQYVQCGLDLHLNTVHNRL